MNPLISVIVPVYNVEAYLPKCIESILSQTYHNLEIILIDDGSTDNCDKICDHYAAQDERVIVIHKQNAGSGFARNSGINIFTGEYVMFVDSDDYLRCDCVEVLYHRLVSDNSDIAICNYVRIYDDGHTKIGGCKCFKESPVSCSSLLEDFYLHCSYVTAWGKLYKRRVIEDISYPKLSCGEDTWVFGDIMEKCKKISFVNSPLYYYYQRSNSILHTRDEKKVLDSICADLRLTEYLLKKNCLKNAAEVYASCIDRALTVNKANNRIKLFKQFFDRKTRAMLVNATDFKTKLKWQLLFCPYANKVRVIWIKTKNKRQN